jgi:hypothetical protein
VAGSIEQHRIFRQGDVLVREIDALPPGLHPVPRDEGRIILAYGETTGHAHAIAAPDVEATLLTADERHRFLRLMASVHLDHEEHGTIAIPPGIYEVIRQREWTDSDGDEEEESWRYAGD